MVLVILLAAAFVLYRTGGGLPEGPPPEPEAPSDARSGTGEASGPSEGPASEPAEEGAAADARRGGDPEAAAAAAELPPLDESDAFVRERARALSSEPAYERWLGEVEGLVRRGVASVENLAAGASPARHWRALAPERPFTVRERPDGSLVPAPESYARYDPHAAAVDSIDVERTAELYRRLRPLLRVAYRELGHPEGGLEEALREAIAELRATPRLEEPPELEERGARWVYRDPRLEALSPAQKQLLRMGPENAARVRAKLDALAEALDLETPGERP